MLQAQPKDDGPLPLYGTEYLVILRPHTTDPTPCEVIHFFKTDVGEEWEYLVQPVGGHARFVVKADELELAIDENVKKNTDT